jgi:hypothetical protein
MADIPKTSAGAASQISLNPSSQTPAYYRTPNFSDRNASNSLQNKKTAIEQLNDNGSRMFSGEWQTLGGTNAAMFVKETAEGESNIAGFANTLIPTGNKLHMFDVVKNYEWTLSNKSSLYEEVPYVLLREYKLTESVLRRQFDFYSKVVPSYLSNSANISKGIRESLSMYDELMPKKEPTKFSYRFPYFNKSGLELSTKWKELGSPGDLVDKVFGKDVGDLLQGAAKFFGKANNSDFKIRDRPKIFEDHSMRTLNIELPLYNTINPDDWYKNRELLYVLMSQNLFNKRDHTTGIVPVFYDVYIPGQYYSWASYISKYDVEHLGNQRILKRNGTEYIVPDCYNLKISLTELFAPSKNQFESVYTGAALNYVEASVKN